MNDRKISERFDRGDCILTFGDTVRVRDAPVTVNAGIAGATGQVMGETTPSITGVAIIGMPRRDYALFISIRNGDELWVDPDLLEFIDHGAGTTVSLRGVSSQWTRTESGQWRQTKLGVWQRLKRWIAEWN